MTPSGGIVLSPDGHASFVPMRVPTCSIAESRYSHPSNIPWLGVLVLLFLEVVFLLLMVNLVCFRFIDQNKSYRYTAKQLAVAKHALHHSVVIQAYVVVMYVHAIWYFPFSCMYHAESKHKLRRNSTDTSKREK
jgi:hypothetical protein